MFIQYIFFISLSFHINQAVYQEKISFGNNYQGINNLAGFNGSYLNNHPHWAHNNNNNHQVNKDVLDRHPSANNQIDTGKISKNNYLF